MERQMALQEGANRWLHSEQESQIRLRLACTRMIGRKALRKETT